MPHLARGRIDPRNGTQWQAQTDLIAALPYGHADVVCLAVERMRQDYAQTPDPAGLLPEPFTLRVLRELHEAVADRPLMRDTFRRQTEP